MLDNRPCGNDLLGKRVMPHIDTPTSICRFGIACGDITPPVGIYHRMWGAASHDRAEGVHRPLTATAMVFQSVQGQAGPESLQILIALDHCLLGTAETQALLGSASRATGLPTQSMAVVFSHTHAAGLMSPDRVELPGGELIPPYLARMQQTIADLVGKARSNAQPATITYGLGHCDLAANRDRWDDASRQWVCGFNPDEPADDTLLVARVIGADHRPLATIVNYACHATTLAWQNRLISPDFPGAMREVVERATGAPCVFLQGASGDLGPREGFVGDVEVADRNGRQLGHAALAVWFSLPPPATRYVYKGPVVSGATLGIWSHVSLSSECRSECEWWRVERSNLDLPYRADLPTLPDTERQRQQLIEDEQKRKAAGDESAARDLRALAERKTRLISRLRSLPAGRTYPFETTLWRIGPAVWLAVQGEPYNLLQKSLRKRFPRTPIVVTALAGGWGPSYLPPQEKYGQGLYQESIAVLEAGSLERLIADLEGRIKRCLEES